MSRNYVGLGVLAIVAVIVLGVMLYEPPPEVTRTEMVGEPTTYTATQSCSTPGLCLTCGLGFDGKFSCGIKISPMCPGEREVSVEEQLIILHYEDGTSREKLDRKVTPLGSCKQT